MDVVFAIPQSNTVWREVQLICGFYSQFETVIFNRAIAVHYLCYITVHQDNIFALIQLMISI
ncbi:hypothetical protein AR543_02605 [Paenibacillus bovis]|uniref:Uncharacterized protein n=1 Tax=Paenibacillus bovis TaxID=1616788 RepID=A0A172ZC03_9BACL|nr:hypothetical protein AR543_02605 [Paenibacillus bovis]